MRSRVTVDQFICGNEECAMFNQSVFIRYHGATWDDPGEYETDVECPSCYSDLELVDTDVGDHRRMRYDYD